MLGIGQRPTKVNLAKVSSKLSPTIGGKEYFNMGGEEVARWLGSPELMALSSLGKYLNKDKQKLKFWLDTIVQYIVQKRVDNDTYQANTKKKHRYNYFSHLNEGE